MLIEYLPNIVACLVKDPNRQVRRIAASTLGNMATIIATLTAEEQQKAYPISLRMHYTMNICWCVNLPIMR